MRYGASRFARRIAVGHVEAAVRVDEDFDPVADRFADALDDGHRLEVVLGRVAGGVA